MCGIAGIMDITGQRPIDETALARMNAALVHRGPDASGTFTDAGIGLTHRRLAIIDLHGGGQPFHAHTGRHVLTFNGEIYNYRDLRRTLETKNIPLKTQSDTEALTEGLALQGKDYIDTINGMFAFAFWDATQKCLLLARDRLGEKPLYYGITPDGWFVFASELTALMASGYFRKEISPEALCDYLHFGYVPDPKSIFRNIYKLPAGHTLTIDQSGVQSPQSYWTLSFDETREISFQSAREELTSLIDDIVSSQMISDVPLGAFLSGGIDSSAIVAAMASKNQHPITCHIGFDESQYDERGWARQVATLYDCQHHEAIAGLDVASILDQVAGSYGEPFADSSAIPSWMVAKLARSHVTVALSGDGGDEVFAGYRRYPFFLREDALRQALPGPVFRNLFKSAGTLYPKFDRLPRYLRFKSTLQSLGRDRAGAYFRATTIMPPERARSFMSPDLLTCLKGYRPEEQVRDLMSAAGSTRPLDQALFTDLKMWLPGRMLVKVDRASMAHSLEVRPPLIDHRLVEWSATITPDYKLKARNGKRILKSAVEDRLPDGLTTRRKRGFDLPVSRWLRAETNNPLERLAESDLWHQSGVLNRNSVLQMQHSHKSGHMDFGQELWSVIMMDAFLRDL